MKCSLSEPLNVFSGADVSIPREEKQPCCRALLGGDTPIRGQEDALPYLGMWKGEAQFKPFKARSRFLFKFQIEIVVDPRSIM